MSSQPAKEPKYQTPIGTEDDPYTYRDLVMFISCFLSLCVALVAYGYCMKLILMYYHDDYAIYIMLVLLLILSVILGLLLLFNSKVIYPWIYKDIIEQNKEKMKQKKE